MIIAADAMHHWVLRCAFAGLALWLLFAAWAQHELRAAAPVPASVRGGGGQILIVYDERGAAAELEAAQAGNLAGRFGRARFRTFGQYRRGDLAAYDGAVVIAAGDVPASLAADVRAARNPMIWIGPRSEEAASAARSGTLFHIAESPFAHASDDGPYLLFADILYEALAPETAERHRAMVRVDHVGPDANPRRIRGLADILAAEGVPFSIAVYDSYRDPTGAHSDGRPIALSLHQRPQIVAALRHAVSRGATLVSQGHTHQTDSRPNPHTRVSGADAEFFAVDLADGAVALRGPLPRNDVAHWQARFEASARAWHRSGLERPRLFAASYDAASAEAYQAARKDHFARYGRGLYFAGEVAGGRADYARGWTSQFLPYPAVDLRGDFILPENLGAIAGGRGPERVVAAAERNLAVRDGFASFSFPWYENPDSLRIAVRGIKALGYRFVSPEEVVRTAPAHASGALHRASPVAAAASGWVRALPPLELTVMVALLSLIAAMWLGGERLLRALPDLPRRPQRAAA